MPGDILELGVLRGTSLAVLARLVYEEGEERHVWGIDSFPKAPHRVSQYDKQPGNYGPKREGLIREKIAKQGAESVQVTILRGLVEDILPTWKLPVALVHVDTNLYSSYRAAMENLWPLLTPGGVMVFDEYGNPDWPGATKAVDDYLATLLPISYEMNEGFRHWVRRH